MSIHLDLNYLAILVVAVINFILGGYISINIFY